MAALFAVGLPFTYDGTTNHFATTTGGTATVAAVTSADTVTVDSNSGNATLTIGAAWSCTALTINNVNATVACDATHGITASGAVTLTTGTLKTNGNACSFNQLLMVGAATRALDITNSTITLNANGTTALDTGSAGLTLTRTGSTILFASNGQLRTGTVVPVLNNVTWSNIGGNAGIGNSVTINGDLTVTGGLSKAGSWFFVNSTFNGNVTINGNSATNRLLIGGVNSSGNAIAAGTQRTMTVNGTITTSNTDWQDIKSAGTASWDFSAATGGSGDCGGNSGITFTPNQTNYGVGWSSSGNWSNSARFASSSGGVGGTGRVPLPQDNVVFDANSGFVANVVVTADMSRLGTDIDWTGTAAVNRSWSFASVGVTIFGSVTLSSAAGMSITGTFSSTFGGRGTHTLTSAGHSWTNAWTFNGPGGTYTLQDTFTCAATITLSFGTLDANGFDVQASIFASTATSTRVLKMGGGQWRLTATSASAIWSVIFTGLTVVNGGSEIVITTATANNRTFAGSTHTYGALTYTVAGSTGSLILTGGSTFSAINFSDVTNARTLTLPASTITTITNGASFNVNGTAGKLMTLNSSIGATQATLAITSGTVNCDYLAVVDNIASVTTPAYAGVHGTISNTTNWLATAAPTGTLNLMLMGIGN